MSDIALSVTLITHNESRHIAACLKSVAFADEWVLVDSGSTDDTAAVAARCGARVTISGRPSSLPVCLSIMVCYV